MDNFTDNFKFKPFEQVLVRDTPKGIWVATNYSHFVKQNKMFKHKCTDGIAHQYCIPYEDNEHLLGTNKDFCMPNKGNLVLVSNDGINYSIALYENYNYDLRDYVAYIYTVADKPIFQNFRFCKYFNGRG